MKERPILFSAPMVRAILEGRKTVTRRVVKPYRKRPIVNLALVEPTLGYSGRDNDPNSWGYEFLDDGAPAPLSAWPELCPYGQPGDRLWVRETWQYFGFSDEGEPCICYLADHGRAWPHVPQSEADKVDCIWADLSDPGNFSISGRACDNRWRPSIHMPRWASRITLEVTGVSVERLQDISEADAIAEGIMQYAENCGYGTGFPDMDMHAGPTSVEAFANLWASINGPDNWNANPWVWVVEFQRMESA